MLRVVSTRSRWNHQSCKRWALLFHISGYPGRGCVEPDGGSEDACADLQPKSLSFQVSPTYAVSLNFHLSNSLAFIPLQERQEHSGFPNFLCRVCTKILSRPRYTVTNAPKEVYMHVLHSKRRIMNQLPVKDPSPAKMLRNDCHFHVTKLRILKRLSRVLALVEPKYGEVDLRTGSHGL